uniref:DUF753 domain-containing protein n=1 Tax=Anopheles merus TaxID=30066 RepID=A0A182V723_ANOME
MAVPSSFGRLRSPTLVALVFVVICALSCDVIDAKECYTCDGESCVRVSTAGITVTCPNTNDLCYTQFDQATLLPIKRGCLTQTEATTCTGDNCVACNIGDLCNEISSPKHQCVVCSSLVEANCLANPTALTAVQCPAPSNVDLTAAQCYSRVIGTVTERGCITTQTDVDRCTGLDCATCIGTGCNKDEFPADRIQCVQCDNADSCNSDATTAAYCDDVGDVCVTMRRANGNVMKSCKNAMVAADASYCLANPSLCSYCGKKLCNGAPFSASPATTSCYQCEGNGCLKTSAHLASCQLTDDGCFSMFDGSESTFCASNSNLCQFCSTDNCNAAEVNFNYVECLSCDSSTDARCATNPAALTTFERCTNCATALVTSGGKTTTRRGCLASFPADVSSQCTATAGNTCQRCSTNRCNVANFPADRLQCYRCVSPPCISHQDVRLEYCPEYRAGDSCLLESDSIGQLLRLDCRSSLTEAELSACTGRCQTCSTSGCNDPQTLGTSGSCVQCRSSLNSLCRAQALQIAPEPCNNPANAQCYSRLVDGVTERGCMSDLAATAQSACARGENCLVCNSRTSNCNTAQYPVAPLGCFQCDSRTDGDGCRAAQTGTAAECPTYDTANKCYTIVQSNGDTVRKCSTLAREVECGTASGCEVCLFSGCNRKVNSAIGNLEPPVRTTTPGPTSDATAVFGSYTARIVTLLGLWFVQHTV